MEESVELWDGAEVGFGFRDGHFEDVGDGFSLVGDFEGFAVEAFAEAGRAFGPCIGEEMHFDFEFAVALAALATAAFCVEGETGFRVAALLGEGEF